MHRGSIPRNQSTCEPHSIDSFRTAVRSVIAGVGNVSEPAGRTGYAHSGRGPRQNLTIIFCKNMKMNKGQEMKFFQALYWLHTRKLISVGIAKFVLYDAVRWGLATSHMSSRKFIFNETPPV